MGIKAEPAEAQQQVAVPVKRPLLDMCMDPAWHRIKLEITLASTLSPSESPVQLAIQT